MFSSDAHHIYYCYWRSCETRQQAGTKPKSMSKTMENEEHGDDKDNNDKVTAGEHHTVPTAVLTDHGTTEIDQPFGHNATIDKTVVVGVGGGAGGTSTVEPAMFDQDTASDYDGMTTTTVSTDMRPGAHRVGGGDDDGGLDDDYTMTPSTVLAADDQGTNPQVTNNYDNNNALDAVNVVQDFEEQLQQRMQERTIDALRVQAIDSANESDSPRTPNVSSPSKKALMMIAIGILFLSISLGVTLSSSSNKQNNQKHGEDDTSLPAPTECLGKGCSTQRSDFDLAVEMFTPLSGKETLLDETTPQHRAMMWIVYEDSRWSNFVTEKEKPDNEHIWLGIWSVMKERFALAVLFFSTGGPTDWLEDLQFLSEPSVCFWNNLINGLDCNDQGSVRLILLSKCPTIDVPFMLFFKIIIIAHTCHCSCFPYDTDFHNLTGTIPSEIAALSSLEEISIWDSNLHGTLPPSLGDLPNLILIQLGFSQVSGSMPESFSKLRKMQEMFLPYNALTGTIPQEFLQLESLEYVNLAFNSFSGAIPSTSGVDVIQELREFFLIGNLFSGPIPESLYSPHLELLRLGDNMLTGSLPSHQLAELVNAQWFMVGHNQLSGTLPTEMGLLQDLQFLHLNFNQFSGALPSQLGLLTRLDDLRLEDNHLSGMVPTELGSTLR